MTISQIIKAYTTKQLNKDVLAEYLGISRRTLSEWLRNPTEWRLGKLNEAYDFLKVPQEERKYDG